MVKRVFVEVTLSILKMDYLEKEVSVFIAISITSVFRKVTLLDGVNMF